MAYTAQDFLDDWDVRVQDYPYAGAPTSYGVRIYNECTGEEIYGEVWVEDDGQYDDVLRDELDDIMSDCEAIVETIRFL